MLDLLYSFLSLEFSGLIIALVLLCIGLVTFRSVEKGLMKWVGAGTALIAVVLAGGAVSHLVRVSNIDTRFPAPGKMVDVGGYNVHVLAEGPADGPPVVWFAGGHIGGLGFYEHHAAIREQRRTILIDRPGTGWSDAGPFPRTTAKQAEEMIEALRGAGEQGPFIFAGHSFGGLLAINIARRYPAETAGVILMDATPLDVIFYGLDKDGLRAFSRVGPFLTLKHVFGFYRTVEPLDDDGNDDTTFTKPLNVMQYTMARAGFGVAAASAFEELTPEGLIDRAYDTVVFDGELGDIPVYLVAPKDEDPETLPYAEMVAGAPGPKADRFVAFLKSTRERYLATSNRSQRIIAPPGTGHNFVYQDPEFVIETVEGIADELSTELAEYRSLTTEWPGPFGGLPPVDIATPDNMERAITRAIAEKRFQVELIANADEPADFENTIVALESSGLALERSQQLLAIFTNTATNPGIAGVQARVIPEISKLHDEIAHNQKLFSRVRTVYEGLPGSAPDQEGRRLVQVAYDNLVRRGAQLNGADKQRLRTINAGLAAKVAEFSQNANQDEARLVVFVDSASELDGLPDAQLAAAKLAAEQRDEPDRWAIPISRPSVWPVLTHVNDRGLREDVWRKWVTRGGNDGELDNGPVMTEILRLRGEKAKLLGYPTFAHYQTDARMVGTPDVAMEMMLKTWDALVEPTQQSISEMQAIASEEGTGFELEAWDRLYYGEKLKQRRFNFKSEDILPYFSIDNVLKAMIWAATQVYDFEFRELQDVAVVSSDIRVFEVVRDGETAGVIWMDLFARSGKGPSSWAAQYRPAENFRGKEIPLVVMHSAAQKPVDGGPVLIDWPRANVIFHEFGHTLQTLSIRAKYPSLGALTVPWDFIEVPALLNERWFVTDEMVSRFLVHHETKAPMPAELLAKLRESLDYDRVFSVTQNYLAGAIVDMRLHLLADGREIDAESVEEQVLEELNLPKAIDLILYVPHAFHTFSPQYAASVYTYLWSDVLAADIAEAFLEAPGGFYDKDIARQYRDKVLDIGNIRPVEESFRDFRGRDPDPDALLRRFDLL